MKNTKLVLVALLLVAVASAPLFSAGAREEEPDRLNIVVSFHDPSLEWAQPMSSGLEDAAAEYGFDVQFIGPTPADPVQQVEQVRTLFEQDLFDGLAIAPLDEDTVTPLINEISEAGIPVVTLTTDAPDSQRMAFYGETFEALEETAYDATRMLVDDFLGGQDATGKVAILNALPEIPSLIQRVDGTRRALEEYPELEVLPGTYAMGTDVDALYGSIEGLLESEDDIVALFAMEALNTPTVGRVIRDKGLQGEVLAQGYDITPEAISYVEDNSIQVLVGQNPYAQGYYSTAALYRYLTEGVEPESVVVDAEFATPDTVEMYLDMLQ